MRIGISPELREMCDDRRIYELFEKIIKVFAKKTKSNIIEKNLKHVKLAVQAYYPIVYVEFFSGTRKFDGRKYGKKIEESCGEEVLKRIIGGKEMSKAEHEGTYYRRALAVKDLIRQDFENAFKDVDVLITPVVPALPPMIGTKITPELMYFFDALTVPANLAGICSGVVKGGIIDNVPVGIQISAPSFKEKLLFDIMKSWQDLNI
jgi:aspartyl-tRNA(Asn)/glutamyl-tRNA(Gln) amidotransferase subunit A